MLEDLDCANCARKMEEAIKKIDGVEEIHVNFLTQKMILTADDDRFDAILKEAVRCIRRVEPDCSVKL
jgi:copper chaperone CopZ